MDDKTHRTEIRSLRGFAPAIAAVLFLAPVVDAAVNVHPD